MINTLIFEDQHRMFDDLTDAEAGRVLKRICKHAGNGQEGFSVFKESDGNYVLMNMVLRSLRDRYEACKRQPQRTTVDTKKDRYMADNARF